MSEFLRRFAATRPPDEHAVMVLDGAVWHDRRAIRITFARPTSRSASSGERLITTRRPSMEVGQLHPYLEEVSR